MSRYVSRYYDHAGVTSEDGKSLKILTRDLADKSVDYEDKGEDTQYYGSSDDHYNGDDLSPPRRHSFAPPRRHPFLPPTPAQETRPEVDQMKVHGKKRKLMEKREGVILPEMKRLREELSSHPLYEENTAKAILISNDGQRFSVDAHTLSTLR